MSGANIGTATVEIVPGLGGFYAQIDRALSPLSGKFGKFSRAATIGLAGVGAAGLAAGAAFVDIGEKFHESYNTIRTETGKTGAQLDGLEKSFKRVVSSTPADFGDASKAVAGFNQRLGLTGKPLEALTVQLLRYSRITKTDVGGNVDAVTKLFNNWRVATDQQVPTLNRLFRLGQATGVGLTDLAGVMLKFSAPLHQLGFGFDQSAAMIASFERSGLNVNKMMPGLVFGLKTFAKAGKEPGPALAATFKEIERLGKGTAATQLAIKVFGARAGIDIANAVETGRLHFSKFTDAMEHGRNTINKTAHDTATLGQKFDLFKNKVLVLLEPVAMRVFDEVNRGASLLAGINFQHVIAQTAGLRSTLAALGQAVFPIVLNIGSLVLRLSGLLLTFSNTRLGMTLLGAAAGALLGRMVALGVAFGVQKVLAFIGGIRDLISTFGVLRTVYLAQTGATNASTAAVLRFAVAQKIAAGASEGMATAMASTGFGALVVLVGTVAGALLGMSSSTDHATTSARDLNDALRAQADALRAVRDIDLDVAQRKADVRSANVAVQASEARLATLRRQGQRGTIDYKQAEADLGQARVQAKRAVRDLGDAQSDETRKIQDSKTATAAATTKGRDRIATLRGEVNALRSKATTQQALAVKERGYGALQDDAAKRSKNAADLAAQLAVKERALRQEIGRQDEIRAQQRNLDALSRKLGTLKAGSGAYQRTASAVRDTESKLNDILNNTGPATKTAGAGFQNLGSTVSALGGALGDVSTYTNNTTNELLKSFGAKPLKMTVKPFKLTPGQKFMQALGLQRGGPLTGGAPSGDSIPILGERGEYMLNRQAVRKVGVDVLDKINFGIAPRHPERRQAGGMLGTMVGKANEIDSHHYPYRWGGGHDPNFTGPYDCSGAWSALLHAAGVLGSPLTSGQMVGLGSPGVGAITILANPTHVYGMLAGRAWGTSGQNPGGGAGWFNGGIRSGFAIRHIGPTSGDLGLDNLEISGGTKTMQEVTKGVASTLKGAADAYVAKNVNFGPAGAAGDGTDAAATGDGADIMRAIAKQRGWNFSDWWAIDAQETGHGRDLFNPSSGAAERGQFLPMNYGKYGPGSDPAKHPSVAQQIQSMADYISARYGTATAAEAHEKSFGWYQSGGLIQAMKKGGPVASTGSIAQQRIAGKALMHRIWSAARAYYPGGRGMPQTTFGLDTTAGDPFVGDLADASGARKGRVMQWPDWLNEWFVGPQMPGGNPEDHNAALQVLVHEWAHHFQKPSLIRNGTTTDVEGGAQAFARSVAPRVYASLKMPFSNPGHDTYLGYATKVLKDRGVDWVMRGQFIGKQSGGLLAHAAKKKPPSFDSKKPNVKDPKKLDPLAVALPKDEPIFAGPKSKKRTKVLNGLLKKIGGIGLSKTMHDQLAQFESDATVDGDHADLAGQLTTQDPQGNDIPGVFGGKHEIDWLNLQLDSLFQWRNLTVRAQGIVQKQYDRVLKLIQQAAKRLADVIAKITAQNRVKKDLEEALKKLRHDPAKAEVDLEAQIKKLRKSPHKNAAKIHDLETQLHALQDDRKHRGDQIKGRIDAITKANTGRGRLRDTLRDKIIPAYTKRRDDMHTDLDSYGTNLETIQGPGGPTGVLGSLPGIGVLGGSIFNAQLRIQQLLNPGDKAAPVADVTTADTSEKDQLTQGLIDDANKRAYIANQQFDVLKGIPFAGVFHQGGTVPGRAGDELLALVQAGETITPAGDDTMHPTVLVNGDIVSRHPDPVEVVLGDKRFPVAVKQANRAAIRGGRHDARAGELRRG